MPNPYKQSRPDTANRPGLTDPAPQTDGCTIRNEPLELHPCPTGENDLDWIPGVLLGMSGTCFWLGSRAVEVSGAELGGIAVKCEVDVCEWTGSSRAGNRRVSKDSPEPTS